MKNFLKGTLYFLRLTDDDGLLSITHIACIVVLIKVALAPEPSIADMGALLITLALYYGKKVSGEKKLKLSSDGSKAITDMQSKMQQVQDKLAGVAAQVGFRNLQK